jgi:hypothetical protein
LKRCPRCQTIKQRDEFGRNRGTRNGLQSYCRSCMGVASRINRAKKVDEYRARERERYRIWRSANPEAVRRRQRKHMIRQHGGIPPGGVGPCEVCGTVEKLNVDHDHDCCPSKDTSCGNCFRGYLCTRCNHMLGHAYNNPARLRAAADYLERPRNSSDVDRLKKIGLADLLCPTTALEDSRTENRVMPSDPPELCGKRRGGNRSTLFCEKSLNVNHREHAARGVDGRWIFWLDAALRGGG